jgi:preprotein translocase subunit YajC
MGQLLFPLLLVALLVPMFLGVRRQRREAQKVATMQQELKIGDRVTTTSGLYGTVVDADDTSVDLEIAEDVVTTWLRAAIRDIRTEDAPGRRAEPGKDAEEPALLESAPDEAHSNGIAPHDAAEASAAESTASNGAVPSPHDGTENDAAEDDGAAAAEDPSRLRKD